MLIFKSRSECEIHADLIKEFLNKELRLDFPATHKKIAKLSRGVETLGARFLPFYRKIRNKTYRRSERLFKQRCRDYEDGAIGADTLNASWQSLMGMLRYGHNIQMAERLINIVNIYA